MRITGDGKNHKLSFLKSEYVEKVLERFNMQNVKLVITPLANHFKQTKEMCPKTQEEMDYMCKVPYPSTIGILMYTMVCIRPNILLNFN